MAVLEQFKHLFYMLQIARLRTTAKLTQSSLAQAIGVSPDLVQHWELGTRGDRLERTVWLCAALGCEAETLLDKGLKTLRLKAGLTQAQLAAEIGVSDRIVRAWERGEKKMEGLDHAVTLCDFFGCKTLALIEKND